jgi:lipopolysaccharide export system permease protein
MLFDSTLRRDLSRNFAATLVVVLTIVITIFLIRTLGQAAGGRIAPQDVVLLLGYTALGHLPTMLALALFIAVVTTLGRMYRDSEMVVWFASGISLSRFVRPVVMTAWPVLAVVAALALVVWPWVNEQSFALRDRFEKRSDLSRVAPGQFQSSADGRRVFFIERDETDSGSGRNVFVLTRGERGESVTSAGTGRLEWQGEDRYLVLEKGQRNELDLETGAKTLSQFESYRVLAGERTVSRAQELPPIARSTLALLRQPSARGDGELVWRIGLVMAAANMLLLGVGLSASSPRRPSNWNLLFALLGFVVYYNLINLSQAWVAGGQLGLVEALVLVHGAALAAAGLLILGRDRARFVRPVPRSAAQPPAPRPSPRRGAG